MDSAHFIVCAAFSVFFFSVLFHITCPGCYEELFNDVFVRGHHCRRCKFPSKWQKEGFNNTHLQ